MTQVAARHGYAEATVARVVDQAGVSRATFYEHFADKEACFLVAFEQAAGRIESSLIEIDAGAPPSRRAAALLDDLLMELAAAPAEARIVFVEALAGGAKVRKARERLASAVEAMLEGWLGEPTDGYWLGITGRAVTEGAGSILAMRAFRGETARIADLRGDLIAWINSYSIPVERPRLDLEEWRQLGAGLVEGLSTRPAREIAPRRLPRGKSAATPKAVASEHRERILAAVAQLTRTKGYTAMTVSDIVKTGSVSRESFYELFRSKEDAFLATQSVALEKSIAVTAAAFFGGESWPERVWDGLAALLGYIGSQPDLVYLDVFESYAAGAAAIRRSFDDKMAYTLFLEDGYRQSDSARRLPRLCSEAIGGAILGLLRWQVREGRTDHTLELLPQAVYLALTPFVGPAAAMELVEAKATAEGEAPAV